MRSPPCRFSALIGVGGIGTGKFFALNGNETLGREESRSGRFLERRDYCKLHIIAHYVQTLMGAWFKTIAVGAVGDDEWGAGLLAEMQEAGIDTRFVATLPGEQTLFALCYVYPDGSGGNLTVDDSACARVNAGFVRRAAPAFAEFAGRGIALAVPEVPLEVRQELLEMATIHGYFRCASVTTEEARSERSWPVLERADLVSLNLDEAIALAGQGPDLESTVERAFRVLRQRNNRVIVAVTAGRQGSWVWDGSAIHHAPALAVEAVNTAGAGDCFMAGLICGLAANLPVAHAQQLATAAAAMSVTSPHTIHKGIDRSALKRFTEAHFPRVAGEVLAFLSAEDSDLSPRD